MMKEFTGEGQKDVDLCIPSRGNVSRSATSEGVPLLGMPPRVLVPDTRDSLLDMRRVWIFYESSFLSGPAGLW